MNNSKQLYYDHIDKDNIDHILKNGVDINAIGIYHGRKDFTLLHAAVANSDEELVKYLLNKNVDINATTSYKETALHIAAERDLNIVSLLIQHGAEISAVANYGLKQCWTPLHCAIRYRNEDIAKFLLEKGARCKIEGCECILHFSVRLGMIDIVELLFKHFEIKLPCICNENSPSLLFSAVENDHEEIVTFLINKFNNVKTLIKNNELILHQAVKNNNYKIINQLLNGNVDINSCDKNKKTALAVAESTAVANLIKRHVLKLKFINYFVSEDNLKLINIDDKLDEFEKKCQEEIKSMKLEKIGDSYVNFFEIFNKSIHQLAIYMANEKIRRIVDNFDEVEGKFPIYTPLFLNRLREGLIRRNFIEKIEDFIFDTLEELPDVFL
ncbi:hypothetical protein KQX54_002090 [Cotesia glomerata]|uniref:Ankyrin repeat protein n=1 Tax=Cotesia glomerata TaxID=32391 RepID=A0AAV7HU46_COTGL|nr:hypothetical protein KQX54_002090 [Cotesia glomerata]